MFTGSGHVPYGVHDKLTEGVGGSNNGTTSNDRTTYYETVPSNYLEDEVWLESDRMGFLLDALDLAKLNAQRDIVKNERRQRMDNQPYGRASEILSQATYPSSNPYSWDVIGSMTDLSAASETDVKDFFQLYYAPNNAILTIVGDFDPAQAKALDREVLRRHPARRAGHAAQRAARHARQRNAAGLRGSRAGAAAVPPVADGRREERRPLRPRRAERRPRRFPDRAADQGAGLRPAGGRQRQRVPEHQRGRRRIHHRDHAAAGTFADGSRSGGRRHRREARGATARRPRRFRNRPRASS